MSRTDCDFRHPDSLPEEWLGLMVRICANGGCVVCAVGIDIVCGELAEGASEFVLLLSPDRLTCSFQQGML